MSPKARVAPSRQVIVLNASVTGSSDLLIGTGLKTATPEFKYRGVEQVVARLVHTQEVVGATPTPATTKQKDTRRSWRVGAGRNPVRKVNRFESYSVHQIFQSEYAMLHSSSVGRALGCYPKDRWIVPNLWSIAYFNTSSRVVEYSFMSAGLPEWLNGPDL